MNPLKIVLIAFGCIALVYVSFLLKVALFPAQVASLVVDPVKAIQNYEWFYDEYNLIESTKHNILIADKAFKSATSDEARERKETELNGLRMNLNSFISDYNSKSKMITRNLWKPSKDIPYQISYEE